MGRSVMYDRNAQFVLYLGRRIENEFQYERFMEDVMYRIRNVAPSYYSIEDRGAWVNRETKKILENQFSYVAFSQYMDLFSISFTADGEFITLGQSWLAQMRPKFKDAFPNRLVKQGTMSNGVSVFQKAS